jgi:hypothetical protein
MTYRFKHGDRVQWQEGGVGQYTCTGSVINEEKYQNGTNPFGHWCIKVDDEHYLRACHTASEMNLHWVNRSVVFNKLRPEGT